MIISSLTAWLSFILSMMLLLLLVPEASAIHLPHSFSCRLISSQQLPDFSDKNAIRLLSEDSAIVDETRTIIGVQDIFAAVSRLPNATFLATQSALRAFIDSAMIMIPVGLVMNIKSIRTFSKWGMLGIGTGIEWAKISACFASAQVLCQHIRNVDDKYNKYIGSGVASAVLRFEEGPVGMMQGFVIGFLLFYGIEKLFALSEDYVATHAPTTDGKQLNSVVSSI